MTTQPISVDEIVHTINNDDNQSLSLAEKFIELIRPYNLSETQAIHLFSQVEKQMSSVRKFASTTAKNYESSWALQHC